MIPEGRLSTIPVVSAIIGGRAGNITETQDYEDGPKYLSDTQDGLLKYIWQAIKTQRGISLNSITTINFTAYVKTNIKELSFTFDQNGRYSICMIVAKDCLLYWYDPLVSKYTTLNLGHGYESPKLFLDDKRYQQNAINDMLMFYLRDRNLCYRRQRDRFLDEIILAKSVDGKIRKVGMSRNLRVQIQVI